MVEHETGQRSSYMYRALSHGYFASFDAVCSFCPSPESRSSAPAPMFVSPPVLRGFGACVWRAFFIGSIMDGDRRTQA